MVCAFCSGGFVRSPAHPSPSPRLRPRGLLALSLALAALLAACGGSGSSSGGGDAAGTPPPVSVSAPAPSSALARKYIGTWSGCLWVQRTPGDRRNSWNRVTYTLTPDGGDRLSLSSTEERYETDDCSGARPTGVRTETASIRLDGTTLSITLIGSLIGDSEFAAMALLPAMLMLAAMFFCSTYYSFKDCFTSDTLYA